MASHSGRTDTRLEKKQGEVTNGHPLEGQRRLDLGRHRTGKPRKLQFTGDSVSRDAIASFFRRREGREGGPSPAFPPSRLLDRFDPAGR